MSYRLGRTLYSPYIPSFIERKICIFTNSNRIF